jgi:predicted nucleic acid-binding protein
MILDKKLDICYNSIILSEYEGVASRPKFAEHININYVKRLLDIIRSIGKSFLPDPPSAFSMIDETDRIFYDTAKRSNSILVTGNMKHFPQEPFIKNPHDFLDYYTTENLRA